MKKKIMGLALSLLMLAVALPVSTQAAGGPWLELNRAEDTPGSRDVLVGATDVVALKFTLWAYSGDIQVDSLRVNFFRLPVENGLVTGEASPAQPGDVANVRLYGSAGARLTTSKAPAESPSVTFNEIDWLSPPVISQNTSETLSVVFDVPATCNATGLFVSIGYASGTGEKEHDIKATAISGFYAPIFAPVSGSAKGTVMVIYKSGFISFSTPPDAPPARIVAVGTDGTHTVATEVTIYAGREALAIHRIPVVRAGGRDENFGLISLWDGNAQLGTDLRLVNSLAVFTLPPDSPWIIPADSHKVLRIAANLNGVGQGTVSGDAPRLGIKTSGVEAVGLTSGRVILPEQRENDIIYGNPMTLSKDSAPEEEPVVPVVQVGVQAPLKARAGSDFIAVISISEVVDFNAAQYDISFDWEMLQVIEITGGQIGSVMSLNTQYNRIAPGTIRVVQSVGLGKVSGSGHLAEVHFHVVDTAEVGSTMIGLTNGLLANFQAEGIPASWDATSVEIFTTPPGDVNQDGVVNALDVTALVRIILGIDPPTSSADINGDNAVNVLDIAALVRIILSL